MNKFEYKNLTPFKWFVLENFPFIEADFDALTEWQLFCKLGKEINKIITSENTLGTQVESVTNAFIELQNYVNNYFDNLDVTDEINQKLNDMATSGAFNPLLQNLFNGYQKQIDNLEENVNNNYNTLDNKINVNQTNVLKQLSSLSSGSPAGVYPSLSDLQADALANKTKIYLTSDNGHWNYYDETTKAWVDGGVYLANTVLEGITPNQLSFLKQYTYNIFNNDNITELTEGIINAYNIIDTTQTNYYTTPFMPVVEGKTYYKGNNYAGCWYDKDKHFIIGSSFGNTSVTAPSNACYYRTSLLKTAVSSFYVSTLNHWTKYGFNPFYILDKNLEDLIQSLANLKTKVFINDTDFFNTTDTNIFNTKNIATGYALTSYDELIENANFSVTDYLKLPEPTGHIYITACYEALILDSSYNVIEFHSGNNQVKEFDLPPNASYIRVCFANVELTRAKILLNETLESYNTKEKYTLQFRTQEQLLSIISQLVNNGTFQKNIKSIAQGTSIEKQKWCAIGDSWTEENQTAENNYVKVLTSELNLETTNLGISGTGFKRGFENNKAYYQRTNNIPANTEILTIMGSGNDLGANYSLGSPTDTGTDTICGCINTTLDNIFSRFPRNKNWTYKFSTLEKFST